MAEKKINMDVGLTILRQLGNAKFMTMTGAHKMLAIENGLQFFIPRANNIRKVRIDWKAGEDLYHMYFYSVYGETVKLVQERLYVHADDLQDNFKYVTGLDTHL
jgi:hypothetical protein